MVGARQQLSLPIGMFCCCCLSCRFTFAASSLFGVATSVVLPFLSLDDSVHCMGGHRSASASLRPSQSFPVEGLVGFATAGIRCLYRLTSLFFILRCRETISFRSMTVVGVSFSFFFFLSVLRHWGVPSHIVPLFFS